MLPLQSLDSWVYSPAMSCFLSCSSMQPGKKILIVDDSLIITSRLKEMFRDFPNIYSVNSCGSYGSALEWFHNNSTDILILDIDLPQRSGIELLKHIRKNEIRMVVIMYTTHSDPFFRKYCMAQGADYFVDKFQDVEELPALITSLVSYSPPG